MFYGPHTQGCLQNIWKSIGCLDSGWMYPGNHSMVQQAFFQTLNLRSVVFLIQMVRYIVAQNIKPY